MRRLPKSMLFVSDSTGVPFNERSVCALANKQNVSMDDCLRYRVSRDFKRFAQGSAIPYMCSHEARPEPVLYVAHSRQICN